MLPSPEVRYYRLQSWSPWFYVQEKRRWRSYDSNGALIEEGKGRIPRGTRDRLEEIDEAQVNESVLADVRQRALPENQGPSRPDADADEEDDLADDEAMDTGAAFRPRLWRYLLGTAIQLVFALGCSVLFVRLVLVANGHDPTPDIRAPQAWITYYLYGLAVFGVILSALREYFRSRDGFVVRVSGTTVTGPQKWWWGRRQASLRRAIPLARLDRARSAKRSPIDRLLNRQYLYSVSGERIHLSRWLFTRADLRRLMGLLGLGR